MKIGKRRAILGIAGLLASFAAFVPSTASASCTVIIEDGGCIENAICAAFRPLNPDCIQ
jgi:hypothetical protein